MAVGENDPSSELAEPKQLNGTHAAEDSEALKIGQEFTLLSSATENASKAFDHLLADVGDFNAYQWKLWLLIGVGGFFTAFHNVGAVFLAATPKYSCDVPHINGEMNISIPMVRGREGDLEPSKCKYRVLESSDSNPSNYSYEIDSSEALHTGVNLCRSWNYDQDVFKSTVVTEWDLVCDRRWLMSTAQASYMMGILVFAVIFSAISDKIGRRITAFICVFLLIVTSVATAFSSSFVMFLVLRFVVAGSGQGMVLTNFIQLMECLSLKGRNVLGNSYHIFFAVGITVLSLIAYFIRDWRTLQLVCSVPIIVLGSYFWLLPESPRWLLMQGREKEGLEGLKMIAKANKKQLPDEHQLKLLLAAIQKEVTNHKNPTLREKMKSILNMVTTLFRTPNMRRRNLIMFFCWFVTSTIYYGLTFSGDNIKASLYTTVALSGAIEIPAILVLIVLLLWFERRTMLCLNFIIGGAACIAIIFVPSDWVGLNLALATLGKFTVSATFPLAFMLSAELVPTDVRNISIGMASMFARIGSGIAPYIVDLLGDIYYAIPSTLFGILAIVAGCLSLLLPTTGNSGLPESVEQIESMPR